MRTYTKPSKLAYENRFAEAWSLLGGIPCEREYRFSNRLWRFDFAWPTHFVAVEIEGAVWSRGASGHKSGVGITRDCEKGNAAALLGWVVLRFTTAQIRDDAVGCVEQVKKMLVRREKENASEL